MNYIHYKVWDEIIYPFPNFNSCSVEVWEWKSNFIQHFTGHVVIYPNWDETWSMLVKGDPDLSVLTSSDKMTEGEKLHVHL